MAVRLLGVKNRVNVCKTVRVLRNWSRAFSYVNYTASMYDNSENKSKMKPP